MKENVVYNHNSGAIVGFTNMGTANEEMMNLMTTLKKGTAKDENSQPIATHVLCVMIQSIYSSLKFPFAHYPTKNLTGEQIYNIIWEILWSLETIGFKVSACGYL